ncbi:stage 0 sporulation protein B (sporulation initiation phosphotransferase) [Anoxybacillus tepidamans]|uniref:Stage 0 sporulation protein B (Sporulation initiation phosphotransferase) n=1 Tax=Anoxybacteroides tepidamans TaxID=265948 RepID=A0A7W8IQ43_9BACL|nr:sporulation initiation phosphotransferase B [Anoxybacillus tepidamans]MBB5324557.1 stage 0 sporulation protein B (sporulation initiation phosphotransferase) [Anoxybacillus tepidamans]
MEKRWSVLEVLRHSRHDWLNKIQLIKGNLALNKVERVNEIIEEIVRDMQHESKLTNLKADRFAELLLTYNWKARNVTVSYEVLGDGGDLSAHDEELTKWCCALFNMLEQQADMNRENHLDVSIETADGEVRLFFDYCGTIKDANELAAWLERHQPESSIRFDHFSIHNDEMTVLINIHL